MASPRCAGELQVLHSYGPDQLEHLFAHLSYGTPCTKSSRNERWRRCAPWLPSRVYPWAASARYVATLLPRLTVAAPPWTQNPSRVYPWAASARYVATLLP